MNGLARTLLAVLGIALVWVNSTALVMGNDTPSPARAPVDPNYTAGKQAIDAKDWNKAIELLSKADANSADTQNLLGYANRNLGKFDLAFKHYGQALRIDPKHRGAHEYVGEAYLLTNNLAKAEEQLSALDKLCFFPCEEFTDLKKKVAEFRSRSAAAPK